MKRIQLLPSRQAQAIELLDKGEQRLFPRLADMQIPMSPEFCAAVRKSYRPWIDKFKPTPALVPGRWSVPRTLSRSTLAGCSRTGAIAKRSWLRSKRMCVCIPILTRRNSSSTNCCASRGSRRNDAYSCPAHRPSDLGCAKHELAAIPRTGTAPASLLLRLPRPSNSKARCGNSRSRSDIRRQWCGAIECFSLLRTHGEKAGIAVRLDCKRGDFVATHCTGAEEIEGPRGERSATASPQRVDQDRVYAYFSSYGVMVFDHAGASQWTLPLAMPKTHHGSGASPCP